MSSDLIRWQGVDEVYSPDPRYYDARFQRIRWDGIYDPGHTITLPARWLPTARLLDGHTARVRPHGTVQPHHGLWRDA